MAVIRYNTLLLVLAAGCCDAITFMAADELFSAHVTGNFILFAYDIIKGADLVTWVRLLTFPVFVLGVFMGGWLARVTDRYNILRLEGLLVGLGGLTAAIMALAHIVSLRSGFGITLLVVFSMGMQNAFGKLFSKDIYGPTTMMTGNVTQAALDLFNHLWAKTKRGVLSETLKHEAVILGGFLGGCLLGGLVANFFGLAGLLLPGGLLLLTRKEGNVNKTIAI